MPRPKKSGGRRQSKAVGVPLFRNNRFHRNHSLSQANQNAHDDLSGVHGGGHSVSKYELDVYYEETNYEESSESYRNISVSVTQATSNQNNDEECFDTP